MRTAEVFTDIAAAPQHVWDVLTDFASYPAWSGLTTHG